uniref:Elongator complex protein 2 n=1 Tax=Anthurium amnicola TaxID=1678845 RepID=A0A1D1Y0D5_9ARAE
MIASPSGGSSMEVLDVKSVFIGAGCNRVVNNVSWGPSGLVSFGVQNAVALFHPQNAQIWTTLPGHKAVVNCTIWLPSNKDAYKVQHAERHYLLSGSADGVILIWEIHPEERKWRHVLQVPESHKKGVTCITGICISEGVALFASTSSDGTVIVWEMVLPADTGGDCRLTCLEHIFVGSKPMVALSLAKLPGQVGNIVLAMGGLDHKVHLYCRDSTGKFLHACELKGHTDWIRSLDLSLPVCSESGENSIFLVSSSQDRNIRIWKIALLSPVRPDAQYRKDDIGLTSYIEGPKLVAGSSSYQISLESLLIGHEDWVYSVEWHPPVPTCNNGSERHQPLSILSASMDKTMMIWRPEKTTGIWVNAVTVGELSHCALGFYGGHWGSHGESILAHGYGGSFHLWSNVGLGSENWQPQKVPSGHFAAVSDISWARSGEYILSVGHDQTARIFASWTDESCYAPWHEIARPQVHGHDINCVTIIQGKGNHRYVSGADEKVARVFEAPLSFLKSLRHAKFRTNCIEDLPYEVQVLGANMSALGLSQKPIYVHASSKTSDDSRLDVVDSLESVPDAVPTVLTEPPVEELLAWHTLWPESHKLYGHGNELFSLCCDHEGKLVASSCKAQSSAVAEIWLWEVGSWKAVCRLHSHSLTVTQMEFSQDDSFLLAVSRDRHFSVFSINRSGNEVNYQLVSRQEAHKRIIWACSWNPFGRQFATGSRDKTVKIWAIEETFVKQILALPQFSCGVTALSWVGRERSCNMGFLAVGMENGLIELWSLFGDGPTPSDFGATLSVRFDPFLCHVSTVNRLRWRDVDCGSSSMMQLASCGADHCVRVFEIS